ncbi:MAG TPA: hypothetical protein DEF47_10105 [Herpetosiphon sp.]|nr:hypothetical protein [Herpetosiphon sp.]
MILKGSSSMSASFILLINHTSTASIQTNLLMEHGYIPMLLPLNQLAQLPALPHQTIVVACFNNQTELEQLTTTLPTWNMPWIGWNLSGQIELSIAAYKASADIVLTDSCTEQLLLNVLSQRSNYIAGQSDPIVKQRQRHYQRGTLIRLPAEHILLINEGVVGLATLHSDGSQVLVSLCGPQQLVYSTEQQSSVQLYAHSDVVGQVYAWAQVAEHPSLLQRLRSRLSQMERWASMQANGYSDQRILGLLGLLAEQFGKPTEQGTLIDIRLTHEQLASAIGVNRTTTTRLLRDLRNRGLVYTAGHGAQERFCLPS